MKNILYFLTALLGFSAYAQVNLNYYLPKGEYNAAIPTPYDILGYHPGEWHASHDQLLYYMREVSEASDRMFMTEIARSHEGRPLVQLTISSPENLAKIDEIKATHVQLTDPKQSDQLNTEELPIVIWLGYTIHGNEASGSNAALVVAYHLAAAESDEMKKILENAVIILDPCYNPDGMNRFATWVNMHRSHTINPDPNHREYDESWPGGRTNHYWFDLNRDWMPLVHPESRGRIARFHEWKPNILTDHHEMGTNSTFFFQPGIPSRKFPLTPQKNVDLTHKMAAFHAKYLDQIGSLYYSEESFDDFYIGKGSTYPDVNGCVGVLFEQASSRGHAQENDFGVLTFPMTIRNQFITSLSTIAAGIAHRQEFLDYQRDFFQSAQKEAAKEETKAYVFGSENSKARTYELLKVLDQHQIEVYKLSDDLSQNGSNFTPENGYIVPLSQPQYRFAKGILERRTSFTDSLFYDVSSWTLPLAYNIPYAELKGRSFTTSLLGEKIEDPKQPLGKLFGNKGAYAYAIRPEGYYAYRAIDRLLKKNVVVQLLNETHTDGQRTYPRGTMIIPVGIQESRRAMIESSINTILEEDAINVYALATGLAVSGVDLGSRSSTTITEPKVAVLVEGGVSSYEAGEVWHLFDQRLEKKITLLPLERLTSNLSRYSHIVLPNFRGTVRDSQKEGLESWINNGGTVITWKNGGKLLSDHEITNVKYKQRETAEEDYLPYESISENRGAQVTGGAIFKAKVDLSHPLCYGLESNQMALFRNHNLVMEKSKNPYANPIVYSDASLLSGYVSQKNLQRFNGSPAVTISNVGRGKVITFADNPNFRAFWWGTNKLFLNALFFGDAISRSAGE
ncbi:MAG: M14 family metallopeptidase [Bacteroidota bacterium]